MYIQELKIGAGLTKSQLKSQMGHCQKPSQMVP